MSEPLSKAKLRNALAALAVLFGVGCVGVGVVALIVAAIFGYVMDGEAPLVGSGVAVVVGVVLVCVGWHLYEDLPA